MNTLSMQLLKAKQKSSLPILLPWVLLMVNCTSKIHCSCPVVFSRTWCSQVCLLLIWISVLGSDCRLKPQKPIFELEASILLAWNCSWYTSPQILLGKIVSLSLIFKALYELVASHLSNLIFWSLQCLPCSLASQNGQTFPTYSHSDLYASQSAHVAWNDLYSWATWETAVVILHNSNFFTSPFISPMNPSLITQACSCSLCSLFTKLCSELLGYSTSHPYWTQIPPLSERASWRQNLHLHFHSFESSPLKLLGTQQAVKLQQWKKT